MSILCVATVIAAASWSGFEYIGGRLGTPLAIGPFPVQIVSVLAAFLSLASLFSLVIFALIKRRPALRAAVALAVSFAICLVGFTVTPAKVFRVGFRHRITSTVTADELREIARVSRQTLPMQGRMPGPEKKSLWNESEHRAHWTALTKATALSKLDPTLTLINGPSAVTISWGGALVGHWGLIIQTDGKSEGGDIAGDIATFMSSE
ncbi:MAG: hypothetical protein IPK15_20225 [Verrucomicrobia bacterium]|nr:hypothetical protein [Verrucomicrobiota bacterium]